jgi:hypothetical protein
MSQLNRVYVSALLCLCLLATGCQTAAPTNPVAQVPASPVPKNATARQVAKYNLLISESLLGTQKAIAKLQQQKAISRDDASAVMIWIERAAAASLIVAKIQAKTEPWETQADEIALMVKQELDALGKTEKPKLSSSPNLSIVQSGIDYVTSLFGDIFRSVKK